jgi:hypothetical protein
MQSITFLLATCFFGASMAMVKTDKNVFASLASKFPQIAIQTMMDDNNTITTGYLTAHSYFNSVNCSSEVSVTEWIALGQCSPYHANYSESTAAAPESCGTYVTATGSYCQFTDLCLTYNFFTDPACTIPGTGSCNQTVSIPATCYEEQFFGSGSSNSSALGMLMGNYTPPFEGYTET